MKRIYLVGTSDDNKRLQLAQGRGAKLGSMELPITPKLRALLREVEAERLAKQGKKLPEDELKEQKARVREARAAAKRAREGLETAGRAAREAQSRSREAEKRAAEAEKRAQEAERRATEARQRAEEAERKAGEAQQAAEAVARAREEGAKPRARQARGGLAPGGFERATGVNGIEGVRAILRAPLETPPEEPAPPPEPSETPGTPAAQEPSEERAEAPPRKKAEPMPETKLTPAEIQSLLRSGRGIPSVARQAEAPVDWVRRLAAPIESERLGIVTQLLQSYLVRARLGRSALPVGASIVENLRDRGVRFPERVIEDGWTAWRPVNREWKVRFTYESRGRKRRADWRFEPQSRMVTAENDVAARIAFRAPAQENGAAPASRRGRGASKRSSPRKRASGKTARKRSTTKGSSAKAAAKRSRSKSSGRRSAGR